MGLEAPSGSFVAWADVTESTAVGWAKAALGDDQVAATEAAIDAQIAEEANPTTGEGVPWCCLLYTSPSPRDGLLSRMPSSA